MTKRLDWTKARTRQADTTTAATRRLERQADRFLAAADARAPRQPEPLDAAAGPHDADSTQHRPVHHRSLLRWPRKRGW
jgi:hypothetical protein